MSKPDNDDIGEVWKAYRAEKREKRWMNVVKSTEVLDRSGIEFVSKNKGIHLILRTNSGFVDFWPSTGKWIVRSSGLTGRGVKNLLNYCRHVKR